MFNLIRKEATIENFLTALQQAKETDTLYITHTGKIQNQGSIRTYFTFHSTFQNTTKIFLKAYAKEYGKEYENLEANTALQAALNEGKPLTAATIRKILEDEIEVSAPIKSAPMVINPYESEKMDYMNDPKVEKLLKSLNLTKKEAASFVLPEKYPETPEECFDAFVKIRRILKNPTIKKLGKDIFRNAELLDLLGLPKDFMEKNKKNIDLYFKFEEIPMPQFLRNKLIMSYIKSLYQ